MALVHSDIRGPLYEEALRMEKDGVPVLKLNTGNPGRFGFPMPASVRAALMSRADEAVPYCDVRGMEDARQDIAAYHMARGLKGVSPDKVFITNGVSEAATMLMTALLSAGDEVLMPSPCYSLWSNAAFLTGARPVFYRCDPENGWDPDIDDIRSKLTPRTRAVLVINPNNPTGALYQRETLLAIADIARENSLLMISDEIYDRLMLDGKEHISLSSLAPDVPCVTLNGLSKSHIICGFRCGWMVFSGPEGETEELRAAVLKLASMRLCGNALTQLTIPAALRDEASTRAMLVKGGRLYEQREVVCSALDGIPGVSYVRNSAAFYLFPGLDKGAFDFKDAQDFSMRFLHECHVLVIPGTGFEWDRDLRFRIVMLPEKDVLARAMQDLAAFLDRHRL